MHSCQKGHVHQNSSLLQGLSAEQSQDQIPSTTEIDSQYFIFKSERDWRGALAAGPPGGAPPPPGEGIGGGPRLDDGRGPPGAAEEDVEVVLVDVGVGAF